MGVQINGDTGNISATKADYSGNVTIGGTLTYEDVTNIDSVGLVTARTGIEIGARPGVAASISVDGNMIVSGITTLGSDVKIGTGVTLSPDGNVFATGVTTSTTFSGNLTGNVTGDVTGTATNATNITLADESSDTTCNVLFATAPTGNLPPKTGTNLTFNSNTGDLAFTSATISDHATVGSAVT